MVYNAIVLPHLEYCNVVWENCGISIVNRLQIIQNGAARIICGAPWDTSSATVLDQLNWKPLLHRHQYNTSIWIYTILNNLAPPYLSTVSSFSSNKYNFWQSKNNVFIPQAKTDFKTVAFHIEVRSYGIVLMKGSQIHLIHLLSKICWKMFHFNSFQFCL